MSAQVPAPAPHVNAAPAIVRFVGGSHEDALAYTREMATITLAPLARTMDSEYQRMGQEFDDVTWPVLLNFGLYQGNKLGEAARDTDRATPVTVTEIHRSFTPVASACSGSQPTGIGGTFAGLVAK